MFNLPFAIWLMFSFFQDIPPELENSARLDGYTRFQTFRKIVLPLAAPGIAVTATFCLLFTWNEFLFAFLLTRERAATITVGVAGFWSQQGILWGPMAAAAVVCVVPMMVFVLFLQRYTVRGLTLFENIAFPLRAQTGRRRGQGARRADGPEALQIAPLLDRRPGFLSGGQRQRVALGRALVRDADVYLLDEPISHLHAKLRHLMRGELKAICSQKQATVIHVTHDYKEAMGLSDRIAVLNKAG